MRRRDTAVIKVAIAGAAGSGKTRLAEWLSHNPFIQARRCFQFQPSQFHWNDLPHNMWEDHDFVLIISDLVRKPYEDLMTARTLARSVRYSSPQGHRVCLVATKADLIPNDFSDLDVWNRGNAARCAFESWLPYFSVSSTSGSGIPDLCRFMATQLFPETITPGYSLASILDAFATWTLDCVAAIFALRVPKDVNRETPDSFSLDDGTVDTMITSPTAQAWDDALRKYASPLCLGIPVHKISDTFIVKPRAVGEAENMEFVRANTNIPIPQPRYMKCKDWLVMDFIEGRMLLECWDSLGPIMQFRVVCTLRKYIKELRRLKGDTPGSVVGGVVDGPLFECENRGPFRSAEEFRLWCETVASSGWTSVVRCRDLRGGKIPDRPVLDGITGHWPLVFVHGDLNASNIILSNDGVLWLVDWDSSGFFPEWFESVAMRLYEFGPAPASWNRWRGFIAGSYPSYENFWDLFITDVHRYRR